MEETFEREHISLINELVQGKELAKKLCNHMVPSSPSSHETNELLIEKILSSYEKALTMLNWGSNVEDTKTKSGNIMDSNCSFTTNGSPRSEVIDHEFRHKAVSKKRKTMPRWTEKVKVCSRTGLEGSLDDAYSWRKYGQKDILGAKFPRGYFRCTHRHVQGCLATKQVQRSDEDSTIIEVTYKGRHTCTQTKHLKKTFPSKTKKGLMENQLHNDQKNEPQEKLVQVQPKEAIFTFEAELQVKTEDLDHTKEDIFSWFCFPSSSSGSENEGNKKILLSNTIMEKENHFMESFSSAFISPENSESNLFCSPPCHLGNTGLFQHLQTSVSNSPILDLDMLLDKGDFDMDFPFNTPEYFSS